MCAGMDLALALVEQDHGRELALTVARWLVLFLKRPGGQSQFSAELAAQATEHETIRELQAWAPGSRRRGPRRRRARQARRDEPAQLRARVRARGRRDARALGRAHARRGRAPPARGDDARASTKSPRAAASRSAETLRRAFQRRVRVSPAAYRGRFRSAAA